MTGETFDLSAQFFSAVKDALTSIGKHLEFEEEAELRYFLEKGIRILERSDSYDYMMEVERRLISKIVNVATPKMSLRDIIRRLCPMDPFC